MISNPFQFGIDFDEEDPRTKSRRAAEARQAEIAAEKVREEEPPPPPPPPTVLESEAMAWREAARLQGKQEGVAEGQRIGEQKGRAIGFAEGHTAGQEEMRASLEQTIADTLQAIAAGMSESHAALVEARQHFDRASVDVAIAVVRRLFPELSARHGLAEIEARLREILRDLTDEPRVLVKVSPESRVEIDARIETIRTETGYDGRLAVIADETLAAGDVRIEWPTGGAERLTSDLWRMVDEAVGRVVGPPPPRPAASPAPPEKVAVASGDDGPGTQMVGDDNTDSQSAEKERELADAEAASG
jgi:flagellar assembly protein FliH